MLKFLIGRSGSGKTNRIFEEIRKNVDAKKKTFLLVPEQQIYLSESALASLPASSALYVEIVSFSRLCSLVSSKYGGMSVRNVGAGVRHLIMWQTLCELAPSFKRFKGIKADHALTSMMLSTIDELRSSSISGEDCEGIAASATDTQLAQKFSDIAAVYSCYEENLSRSLGKSAIAAEGRLALLAETLSDHDFFSGADVFIDSFTSFTAEEHNIIELIIKQADNVTLALTHERDQIRKSPSDDSAVPHLKSISQTILRLKAHGIKPEVEILDRYTRSDKVELSLLEQNLWNFKLTADKRAEVPEKDRGAIEMHKCANEYEEIWFAALNVIKEKARGVDYSDIAIILRNPEDRKGIIEAVFDELGIPYFLSERTDLSTTAPARLILSALKCIAHNYNNADVMTLLKTGLLGIDAKDADLFEDYCYTWNINGKRFTEEVWSMNPDGYTKEKSRRANDILESANRVRATIIPPLEELKNQFALNQGNTEENCRALYSYLEKIGLSQRLAEQAEAILDSERPDIKAAGETLRLYDYIISALTDVSFALRDVEINADDLATAMDIMLKHTDIGSVPAMIDYVTIGSAATLRVENIKTAIVLGLCEGEFPANYSDNGILNEHDKIIMEELDKPLSSREDLIISDELFYVYRAMTKPSERLILSTYKSSMSGRAAIPSSAWNRVAFLFPYLTPDKNVHEFDLGAVRSVLANANATSYGCSSAVTDGETRSEGSDDISDASIKAFLGDKLNLSKSAISLIAQCPYKYWGKYVLGLREKNISAVSYDSAGTIVHYVLECAIRELKDGDGRLPELSDSEIIALTDKYLMRYISEINCPLPPSAMYGFSRMRDLALVMLRDVLREFENSRFRVLALEKDVSDTRAGALKPIEIKVFGDKEDSPRVSLTGQIDRIDIYDSEDKSYVRVVDYKTGNHEFNVRSIETGEDLQLPAYLFTTVLEENKGFFSTDKEVLPSGAEFLFTKEEQGTLTPITSGFILDDEELISATGHIEQKKTRKKKGEADMPDTEKKDEKKVSRAALAKDDLLSLDEVLRDAVSRTAQKLYSGKIEKTPSKEACKYCPYRSICSVADKSK